MKHLTIALVMSAGTISLTAHAEPARMSGVALGGTLAGTVVRHSDHQGNSTSSNAVSGAFFADLVTARYFTFGAGAGMTVMRGTHRFQPDGRTQAVQSTSVHPALRVGYLVPLGERAAFWPIASVTYETMAYSTGAPNRPDSRSSTVEVALTPHFLIFPTERMFLRFHFGGLAYRSGHTSAGSGTGFLAHGPMFGAGVGVVL